GLGERMHDAALRHLEPDLPHRRLEEVAILGTLDRVDLGADELAAVPREDPGFLEIESQVQARLPADRRQDRVGLLGGDDALEHLDRERLDVRPIGELRVRHDRRRVRVHEDDPVALFLERLAGLGAGVVELARLADDDRAGADQQDRLQIGASRHGYRRSIRSTKRRKRYGAWCGPGDASGWYCTENVGWFFTTRPSTVRSFRLTCVTSARSPSESGSTAKPWFCAVISTLPVVRSFTGWLPPWCPNLSFDVLPPSARPRIWCPRQMPKTGTSPRSCATFSGAPAT